jgi:hypothetical protein
VVLSAWVWRFCYYLSVMIIAHGSLWRSQIEGMSSSGYYSSGDTVGHIIEWTWTLVYHHSTKTHVLREPYSKWRYYVLKLNFTKQINLQLAGRVR